MPRRCGIGETVGASRLGKALKITDGIHARRAYRSLEPVEITRELVEDLATHAGLSASCFNNQPWRFVFVYKRERLEEMWGALSKGNK